MSPGLAQQAATASHMDGGGNYQHPALPESQPPARLSETSSTLDFGWAAGGVGALSCSSHVPTASGMAHCTQPILPVVISPILLPRAGFHPL